MDLEASRRKVAALTAPRNTVLVGASDRAGSWAARVWRNLNRYQFPGPVYLVNPRRSEIWDQPCYPDFKSLPEKPDHLVIVVPAQGVADLLLAGAAAGARSATIFSAGFGEANDVAGAALGARLRAIIAETGLGVSGPNCMGNVCAKSRLVTLTEDRGLALKPGPVALVGQSGGVMIFINHSLEERGIAAEYLITSGNEAGLEIADYIAFFASESELKVILAYVEGIADLEKFKAACRLARAAGKSVIAVKLGQSESGRQAAMAHTGSLAGSIAAFDAVTSELGVIRADTLDDAVELTELLVHTGAPTGRKLGAITLSGAYRGLLYDAAERNGLEFPVIAPETRAKLEKVLSVGSLIGNPIDGGFGVLSSADTFKACIEALESDPNIDTILLQEALPREPGSDRSEQYIKLVEDYITTKARKPISFITLVSHGQTAHSRALRAQVPHVSFLQEANKALRAIGNVARRAELERLAAAPAPQIAPGPAQHRVIEKLRGLAAGATAPLALNEALSKEVLRAYDIPTPAETLVATKDEAVAAAQRLGFPVVVKAVSADLLHKSDAGAVALGLGDAAAVAEACDRITGNLARHGFTQKLDGFLVCAQVKAGLELVFGLHRDQEMGLVVMAGSGGILLELIKDVAFCAPPVTRAKAEDLLARTQAAKLLAGYRGGPRLDSDAAIAALVGLGRLASDLGALINAVDINPFTVLPEGQGGKALDALIILHPGARK